MESDIYLPVISQAAFIDIILKNNNQVLIWVGLLCMI